MQDGPDSSVQLCRGLPGRDADPGRVAEEGDQVPRSHLSLSRTPLRGTPPGGLRSCSSLSGSAPGNTGVRRASILASEVRLLSSLGPAAADSEGALGEGCPGSLPSTTVGTAREPPHLSRSYKNLCFSGSPFQLWLCGSKLGGSLGPERPLCLVGSGALRG